MSRGCSFLVDLHWPLHWAQTSCNETGVYTSCKLTTQRLCFNHLWQSIAMCTALLCLLWASWVALCLIGCVCDSEDAARCCAHITRGKCFPRTKPAEALSQSRRRVCVPNDCDYARMSCGPWINNKWNAEFRCVYTAFVLRPFFPICDSRWKGMLKHFFIQIYFS